MPRLVRVPVRVVARIRKREAEITGVAAKPSERCSALEFDLERTRAFMDTLGAHDRVAEAPREWSELSVKLTRRSGTILARTAAQSR